MVRFTYVFPMMLEKQMDGADWVNEDENCTRNDVGELSLSDDNKMKA